VIKRKFDSFSLLCVLCASPPDRTPQGERGEIAEQLQDKIKEAIGQEFIKRIGYATSRMNTNENK